MEDFTGWGSQGRPPVTGGISVTTLIWINHAENVEKNNSEN